MSMASSNTCRASLRTLAASKPLQNAAQQTRPLSTAQKRYSQSPTPLYLNFLAPSWQVSRSTLQRPDARICNPTLGFQRRSLSATQRRTALAIKNPRKDDDGNDLTIHITPRAAHRLQTIAETDGNPDLALRVAVESGGCHGFQYLMSLVNAADMDPAEDTLFENEEVAKQGGEYKAKVVMDEPSLELLKGSHIDYTMELIGSQFKVTGIPGATSSCGCGTSFDIAA